MKIRNITVSKTSTRVCYFDLIIEEIVVLKSIRLVRIGENKFMLGMVSSRRETYFSCSFLNKDKEDEVIEAVINEIPAEWIEKCSISKFDPNRIENKNKTLLIEIDL